MRRNKPRGVVTDSDFADLLSLFYPHIKDQDKVAVAVSGGADSLTLLYLLTRWSDKNNGPQIHALTVDHALRPESRAESEQVANWIADWPNVTHRILTWTGRKPKTKISETARMKRYELLYNDCAQHGISALFLGHQMNDQAETILMRLAAGSGLDGLAGMLNVQPLHDIMLLRPLLSVSHDRLCATLRKAGQDWVEDPTNLNTDYARPRLRAAQELLAAEGLTPERLATTAARIARGRFVLEQQADAHWAQAQITARTVAIDRAVWFTWPDDIHIRILTRAVTQMGTKSPRLEQIETLAMEIRMQQSGVYRATLAGAMVTMGTKTLKITPEART